MPFDFVWQLKRRGKVIAQSANRFAVEAAAELLVVGGVYQIVNVPVSEASKP